MRRIAFINQKGGVGKTTSCCNIGAAIASTGRSVLLIDLDPQAHLTMHLGVEPTSDRPSIYDLLTDHRPVDEVIVPIADTLDLVPAHIDLAAAEMELVSIMGREVIFRDALAASDRSYDFIMIDCPPSLGVLTINGLAAMDEVFVPMQPHFLALQGLGKLLETINLVRRRINPQIAVTGIILCMYEAGTRLAGEVATDLADFLESSRSSDVPWAKAKIFETLIRRNIKLAECPSHGRTIFDYALSCNDARDYAAVTAEILGLANLTPRAIFDASSSSDGSLDARLNDTHLNDTGLNDTGLNDVGSKNNRLSSQGEASDRGEQPASLRGPIAAAPMTPPDIVLPDREQPYIVHGPVDLPPTRKIEDRAVTPTDASSADAMPTDAISTDAISTDAISTDAMPTDDSPKSNLPTNDSPTGAASPAPKPSSIPISYDEDSAEWHTSTEVRHGS